jgi:hypothetical protein
MLALVPLISAATCGEEGQTQPDPCVQEPDHDGDGRDSMQCGGDDCDDNDAMRAPGRLETCDGSDHDEDCDPLTFGDRDADRDGYVDAACCNRDGGGNLRCGNDCLDSIPSTHPTSVEACNGLDDDCDGLTDEGVRQNLYRDVDLDGYGAGIAPMLGCVLTPGYSYLDNDCDDNNASIVPGEMRCSGIQYQTCQIDGSWTVAATCPAQTTCVTQPNGTGVCI